MVRQALGKGLDALIKQTQQVVNMPTNEAAVQVQQTPGMSVTRIDVNKIVPNRFQPRRVFNEEKLQELAAEAGLTDHLSSLFRWKPEINMEAWKNASYEITIPLSGAITAKPGRPSFSITQIEE